jgi:hypothetical protein
VLGGRAGPRAPRGPEGGCGRWPAGALPRWLPFLVKQVLKQATTCFRTAVKANEAFHKKIGTSASLVAGGAQWELPRKAAGAAGTAVGAAETAVRAAETAVGVAETAAGAAETAARAAETALGAAETAE